MPSVAVMTAPRWRLLRRWRRHRFWVKMRKYHEALEAWRWRNAHRHLHGVQKFS